MPCASLGLVVKPSAVLTATLAVLIAKLTILIVTPAVLTAASRQSSLPIGSLIATSFSGAGVLYLVRRSVRGSLPLFTQAIRLTRYVVSLSAFSLLTQAVRCTRDLFAHPPIVFPPIIFVRRCILGY
ncbi:hypothetical protein EDB19DRAFT_517384 [Suillus lakei]|nr:hypothetical protein EDB19DRAFT_517384 [Suillus lakei]